MEVYPATTKERIVLDGSDLSELLFERKVETEERVIEVTDKGYFAVISEFQDNCE